MRLLANGSQGPTTLPTPAAAVGTPGYAYNGAPGVGVNVSNLGPDDWNILVAELMAILVAAGISPDNTGANTGQVLAALRALFRAKSDTMLSLVSRSAQGITLGLNYSGAQSVAFTPLMAGVVVAFGYLNLSAQGSATVSSVLTINGTSVSADATVISQAHQGMLVVAANTPVTVTYTVACGTSPGVGATYTAAALFFPYP